MIIEEDVHLTSPEYFWQKLIQIKVNLQATPEDWFIEDGRTMTEDLWREINTPVWLPSHPSLGETPVRTY